MVKIAIAFEEQSVIRDKSQISYETFNMYFQSQSVFTVREIINCEQLAGLGEWKFQAIDMVAGARWQFNTNGIFIYAPTYGRKDIFPLSGNYAIENDKACFAARTTFSVSTSIVSTWCSGEINLSGNYRIMYMDWGNDCSTAAMVTDSLFDSHRRSIYRLNIVLAQVF